MSLICAAQSAALWHEAGGEHLREHDYSTMLEALGLNTARFAPIVFCVAERGIWCVVHGDDLSL